MTTVYEWFSLPCQLTLRCPACRGPAAFEFATAARIHTRADIAWFEKSPRFEYRQVPDSCGHIWHAAIYFPGLHGNAPKTLHDLPAGYAASNWDKPWRHHQGNPELRRLGSLHCTACGLRQRHLLHWPAEAYFAVDYKGSLLWAFNRDSATALLHYIEDNDRQLRGRRWLSLFLHVPTIFKTRKARPLVSRRLRALLV